MYKVSLLATALLISGCAQQAVEELPPQERTASSTQPQQVQSQNGLTLEQIMADPKWIGHAPYLSHWRFDSQAVYFDQHDRALPYPKRTELLLNGTSRELTIKERHQTDQENGVNSPDQTQRAYIYRGNLFLASLNTGDVQQLTQNSEHISQVRFLTDGRLAYRQQNQFLAYDLKTGITQQLLDIRESDSPKDYKEPTSFLEKEQHQLIGWVVQEFNRKKQKATADKLWQQQDPSATAKPIYLGKEHELIDVKLSPTGQYALLAYQQKSEAKSGIMPNYITYDGTIESRKVRQRVAEESYEPLKMVLLNLNTNTQGILPLETLPGMEEDVFAQVKEANKRAYGKAYQAPASTTRKLQLMEDWGQAEDSIQWHPTQDIVAFMVEATDNKDRWIVTFKAEENVPVPQLSTQHRLHDDAWINYDFNSFGWVNDQLYYLSEESGYSNLYLKPLQGKAKVLVSGQQEVQSLTLSPKSDYIYYKSNPKHPGIYDTYRVHLASGKVTQLTDLKGMTDYSLSPDGEQLLLTHSTITAPPELYLSRADGTGQPQKLTQTVSNAFQAIQWQTPNIVAIDSPDDDQPVYAKVFYPTGYQAEQASQYPAVMFVHGAGYLQNVHYGWSGYFREYMFHNLLAEQGYVVMDIDYRASQGYGRDFRTAIYRNMGHPEVEDMALGVDWLAQHANVDQNRVGVYGGSYGGFLTFMSLFTQPELFQAGAALRPVTDWAHYNAPYTSNILNTPQLDPQAYRVSSPIYHAEGLAKPLLINAPMLDNNVFFQDVVRLVQRLIELEKDNFETAIFPVEAHGFKEPSSWLDEYKRIYKLFEENLH